MESPLDAASEAEPLPVGEWAPSRDAYPLAIVWSPIPVLTWLLPFVGHLGIATSDGVVHDFAGPCYVHTHRRRTAFGAVTKYVRVAPADLVLPGGDASPESAWNRSVGRADKVFETRIHNLITCNCHDHVASVLNELRYLNYTRWNTLSLVALLVARGRFVSVRRFVATYAGFVVLLVLVAAVVVAAKMLGR